MSHNSVKSWQLNGDKQLKIMKSWQLNDDGLQTMNIQPSHGHCRTAVFMQYMQYSQPASTEAYK